MLRPKSKTTETIKVNKVRADLHCHSSSSLDGFLNIGQLVTLAHLKKVQYLGICDHDTFTDTVDYLSQMCGPKDLRHAYFSVGNITMIPESEINTSLEFNDGDVPQRFSIHIIAVSPYIDRETVLSKILEYKRKNDIEVSNKLLIEVNKIFGLNITDDDIRSYKILKRKQSQKEYGNIGLDTAVSIVRKFYPEQYSVDTIKNALRRIHKPKSFSLDTKDIIEAIHPSGGIALVAHPNLSFGRANEYDKIVKTLVDMGVDGFFINERRDDVVEHSLTYDQNYIDKNAKAKMNDVEKAFLRHFKLKYKEYPDFKYLYPILAKGSDYHSPYSKAMLGTDNGLNIKMEENSLIFKRLAVLEGIRKMTDQLVIYPNLSIPSPSTEEEKRKIQDISNSLVTKYAIRYELANRTKPDKIIKVKATKNTYYINLEPVQLAKLSFETPNTEIDKMINYFSYENNYEDYSFIDTMKSANEIQYMKTILLDETHKHYKKEITNDLDVIPAFTKGCDISSIMKSKKEIMKLAKIEDEYPHEYADYINIDEDEDEDEFDN